jgi:uncharacterized repeat protein (TIGR03803 family)
MSRGFNGSNQIFYFRAIALLVSVLLIAFPAGAQKLTTTHNFAGGSDGANPVGALVMDSAGNLFGSTFAGGTSNYGTIFKIDSAHTYSVLYNFTGGSDGANPIGRLIVDAAGNLYGAASSGGTSNFGIIFELDSASRYAVLHTFSGGSDGANPKAGLATDTAGNLYGTSYAGGASNAGAIFKIDTAKNYSVLYSFIGAGDGASPMSTVSVDTAGNLYGTTSSGGAANSGTVFKLDTAQNHSVLYSFTGGSDGASPVGNLLLDKAGNLYGTAMSGGQGQAGTVFAIDTANQFSVLHPFLSGNTGAQPEAGLIMDKAGNIYGTTLLGGTASSGTIFKIDAAKNYSVLYSFPGGSGGANPKAGLLMDSAGRFYATTAAGGTAGLGTVLELTLNATISSPPNGSTLPGSTVSFTWTEETDATSYQLWLGSSPNTYDLGYISTSDLQGTIASLPMDGRAIYATLWGYAADTWSVQDTATYTAATGAQITSPSKGSSFTGRSASFTWTAENGANSYQLWVGSTPNSHDLGYVGTTGLQGTLTNLPTDGRTVYATLYAYAGGNWSVQDTATYTAVLYSQITSPAKGSTLTSTSATFTWTSEAGATSYQLWLGSTPGGSDLGTGQSFGLSITMNNLPADGRTIYASLYSFVNGIRILQDTATYTASNGTKAVITAPAKGSTLAGASATFTWSAETGASSYQLWVGSTPGASDLGVGQSFGLSVTMNHLPTDGRTLYVTLYGYVSGIRSQQDTATYTAFTGTKAVITSPAKGSTLPGSSVTFTWSAEAGASSYQLWVGSTPGGSDLGVGQSFGLSVTMNHLPTDGRTVYVTLYGVVSGVASQQDTATYLAVAP